MNQQTIGGLTLIHTLGKIYSKILSNRLSKWAEKHEKISSNQFGFQSGKSTTDAIFVLYSIVSKMLSSKKKLYCAFLDLEKAFDKINRSFLWQKLIKQSISSKLVKALKSMYIVVKSCVRPNSRVI